MDLQYVLEAKLMGFGHGLDLGCWSGGGDRKGNSKNHCQVSGFRKWVDSDAIFKMGKLEEERYHMGRSLYLFLKKKKQNRFYRICFFMSGGSRSSLLPTGSCLAVVHEPRISFSGCGARALRPQASLAAALGISSCNVWLSCSEACGIFLDQWLNLCPLHWQANS